MQLTEFTDYSLRVLLYTGLKMKRCTVREISKNFNVSYNHLVKVVHALSEKGWIISYKGSGGGIELASAALELTIADVVNKCEGPIQLLECFDPIHNTCPLIGVCHLEKILYKAREAFLAELEKVTIRQLIQRKLRDPRLDRLGILS